MSTFRDWETQWNWTRIQSRREKKITGSNLLGLMKEQLYLGQEAMCVKGQYRRGSASETPGELPGHGSSKTGILKMLYCITEDMVLWLKALASPPEYSDSNLNNPLPFKNFTISSINNTTTKFRLLLPQNWIIE